MTAQLSPVQHQAGKLTRTVTRDGVVYEGEGRSYRVEPSSTATRLHLRIEVDGCAVPHVDALNLLSSKSCHELGKRLAGDLHPELSALYELDLRQIVQEESEARHGEEEQRAAGVPLVIARFDGLIDLVQTGPNVAFVVRSTEGSVEVLQETFFPPNRVSSPRILVPPRADQLPFLLASLDQALSALALAPRKVWDAVAEWIGSCSIPPDGYLDLEVAYVFHTHLADRSTHSPILTFVGPPEYGKTRQVKAITYVARRGVWTETPREAHILRYAEDLDATLGIDLWDAWDAIRRARIEDVVLQRFERGSKVARVNHFEAGSFEDTRYYTVYGPTILASNTSLPGVLMSRCLPVPERQSAGKPSRYPIEEDAQPIRAQLIAWRANTLGTSLPIVECNLGGRLADLASPLLQLTKQVAPDRMKAVLRGLEDMRDQKYQRNAETPEGRVIAALTTLASKVTSGFLCVSILSGMANHGLSEQLKLTEQQVSRILHEVGFKTKPYGHDRRAHVVYDQELAKSVAMSFLGIELPTGADDGGRV